MTTRSTRIGHALVVAAVLAGCRGDGDDRDAPRVDVDTTNKDWADGLSAQQVEAEAQAMTPEEAAAAGVAVDTSIHIENLGNSDSILVDDRGQDTAPAAPARRDTVPGRRP